MKHPFSVKKMSAYITLAALIFSFFGNISYASVYPVDGSFTKTEVQTMQTARAETKAVLTLSFFSHIYTGTNYVTIDGFYFHFSGTNTNSVSSNSVRVQTYDTSNTSGITAAGQLIGMLTGFTSPSSGIAYDLTRNSNNVYITARGAETLDGTGIPEIGPQMNFSSLSTLGYSARAARSEVVDFTPANVNPAANEEYILTLSGMTYSATGTTVSEITGKIVAATVASPSPVGSCTDNTTKITCTSLDSITSLSSSVSVTYLSPDTTVPLVTLNGAGTVQMEAGGGFYDEGASWRDNRAGTGTISNYNSGTLDGNVPGTYHIGYTYTDPSGNMAEEVQRTVEVVDTTSPVLTLIGSGSITFELDEYFPDIDEGATWTDEVDGNGTVYSDTAFSSTGTKVAEYLYIDDAGNTGSISRTVEVVDTLPPSLIIFSDDATLSANKFFLEGNTYGAETLRITGGLTSLTGSFDSNGDFSLLVPLVQNTVNTLVVEARDASGNVVTRSVVVTQNSGVSSFSGATQINGDEISKVSQITGTGATATTKLTLESPVIIEGGKSSISATLPTGVEITTSTGGVFDSTQIDITPTTVTGGLSGNQTSRGAIEFGISDIPLHFSKPIKIEIFVSGYTQATIPVLVKHGGSSTFVTTGLTNNPNATCSNGVASSPSNIASVINERATIYSCAASTFTAVEGGSTGSGGGGGGGSSSKSSSSSSLINTATGTTVSASGTLLETGSGSIEKIDSGTGTSIETPDTTENILEETPLDPLEHFATKYVEILIAQGAISTDTETFMPEKDITRAEFLKILFNIHKIEYENTNTQRNDFTDITGDDWTSKIAYTALDRGISSGYADKTFQANAPITRIEAIKFILKISGVVIPETSTSDFTDITEDWMKKYVNKARDLEIISGQETELGLIFRPLDHLSRGEAAKIVVKTMGAGE